MKLYPAKIIWINLLALSFSVAVVSVSGSPRYYSIGPYEVTEINGYRISNSSADLLYFIPNNTAQEFHSFIAAGISGMLLNISIEEIEEEPSPTPTPSPLPSMADFWNGKAHFVIEKNKNGKERLFGSVFGIHFLSTHWEGNELFTYYIKNINDVQSSTGLAMSNNGTEFTDQGEVLGLGDSGTFDERIASFPGVWKDGNTWYLVYEGAGFRNEFPGDIGLATSQNGVDWVKDPNPILSHDDSDAGVWEMTNLGTPMLWKEGNTWYLFYHGFDNTDVKIGVATGVDIRNLRRFSDNPILPNDNYSWESGTAGKRSIIKEKGYYYMVYEVSTDQATCIASDGKLSFRCSQWSSAIARSSDLFTWEEWTGGPVLPQTSTDYGYDGPEWVTTPDRHLHIYFRTKGGTARATLKKNNHIESSYI